MMAMTDKWNQRRRILASRRWRLHSSDYARSIKTVQSLKVGSNSGRRCDAKRCPSVGSASTFVTADKEDRSQATQTPCMERLQSMEEWKWNSQQLVDGRTHWWL